MSKQVTIGLVVPFAEDKVPPEGHQMYPGMTFLPRGVGVRSLTPQGFAAAFDAIPAAADHLVQKGVDLGCGQVGQRPVPAARVVAVKGRAARPARVRREQLAARRRRPRWRR